MLKIAHSVKQCMHSALVGCKFIVVHKWQRLADVVAPRRKGENEASSESCNDCRSWQGCAPIVKKWLTHQKRRRNNWTKNYASGAQMTQSVWQQGDVVANAQTQSRKILMQNFCCGGK